MCFIADIGTLLFHHINHPIAAVSKAWLLLDATSRCRDLYPSRILLCCSNRLHPDHLMRHQPMDSDHNRSPSHPACRHCHRHRRRHRRSHLYRNRLDCRHWLFPDSYLQHRLLPLRRIRFRHRDRRYRHHYRHHPDKHRRLRRCHRRHYRSGRWRCWGSYLNHRLLMRRRNRCRHKNHINNFSKSQ